MVKNKTIQILFIDSRNEWMNIQQYFETLEDKSIDYNFFFADKEKEAVDCLKREAIDIILFGMSLSDSANAQFLKSLREANPDAEIILVGLEQKTLPDMNLLKSRIADYLPKPLKMDSLRKILFDQFLKKQEKLDLKNLSLQKEIENFVFIGKNFKVKEIMGIVTAISNADCNVLIQGESGSGKELIARLVHKNSLRANEVFLPINCGAIPENLLESELFGYEKGAFTGADNKKQGLFEIASKGTLFLDEIGDMPLNFQVKLLRVLETGEFHHIGGTKLLKTNARVISATNKDLKKEIGKGSFRRDLFYRLNVIQINLPPLRERKEDIPLLVDYFIRKESLKVNKNIEGISKEAMEFLTNYEWPGNVRELQNLIDRVILLTPGNMITHTGILKNLSMNSGEKCSPSDEISDRYVELVRKDELLSLDKLEELYIRYVLEKTKYNKNKTAGILNISEKTLYRKIKEYGIKEFKDDSGQ